MLKKVVSILTIPKLNKLVTQLETLQNPEKAEKMSAYMRNQFAFLGVQTPGRRGVTNTLFKEWEVGRSPLDWEFVRELWKKDEREYQSIAIDYLVRSKRLLTSDDLVLLKQLITTKSWWDTVDAMASGLVGHVVYSHPKSVTFMDQWIDDENMWVRRTAILHQLSFKDQTDEERLFKYCSRHADDTEFFIAKAIGWALRQYAKTEPDAVLTFVEQTRLQSLSRREALKHYTLVVNKFF